MNGGSDTPVIPTDEDLVFYNTSQGLSGTPVAWPTGETTKNGDADVDLYIQCTLSGVAMTGFSVHDENGVITSTVYNSNTIKVLTADLPASGNLWVKFDGERIGGALEMYGRP